MDPNMFTDRLANAAGAPAGKGALKSEPLMGTLVKQFGGVAKATEVLKQTILPAFAKSVGTTDIAALRLVSMSDRVAVRRNEETKWLNFLESKDSQPAITDYQYRIKERDIVTDVAPVVNVDGGAFPFIQSVYNQRYNTLTAVGNYLKVSFMASSIAEQQADVNVLEEQIDDEIVRIRRTFSTLLMSSTETVSEVSTQTPQMGGFLTRSTMNPLNAGGSNLSNTLLQTAVNTIGTQLGFTGHQYMLWCTPGQLPIVRDLMINRFPGQTSTAFYDQLSMGLRNMIKSYNVPVQVVWEAYPGGFIPIVFDQQMAANTALLFATEYPRVARFKLDGQVGPYVLARPEQTLYEVVACFDIKTLDDPMQISRVKITNLAS